jgi:hypothetical protein
MDMDKENLKSKTKCIDCISLREKIEELELQGKKLEDYLILRDSENTRLHRLVLALKGIIKTLIEVAN